MAKDAEDETMCQVCFELPTAVRLYPCRHAASCAKCTVEMIARGNGRVACILCRAKCSGVVWRLAPAGRVATWVDTPAEDCGPFPLYSLVKFLSVAAMSNDSSLRNEARCAREDIAWDMALREAVLQGDWEEVDHLIAAGVDVNATATADGVTALMFAAEHGHTSIAKALLRCKHIDVNIANRAGGTALMLAAEIGNTELATMMLSMAGIDVNAVSSATEAVTALMLTAFNGHVEIAKALLGVAGINVNAANVDGGTALIFAAENGHAVIVKALLAVKSIKATQP